jgi:hypothetical protein
MKQKLYILGIISAMIISTGLILKVEHWPAAQILITLGTLTLVLIFLPAALINTYKAEGNTQNRLLYIVTYITCFVVFIGMLFKIQHWPFAHIALLIALPFPYIVFLPVFLAVTSKNKNFNIYNTVFVLLLLALNSVFSCMLALNVSKDVIDDSYNLSRDYKRQSAALIQFPERYQKSTVNLKIDEALKIVNEYQDKILKQEGLSREQWNSNPGNLWRPEARGLAAEAILNPDGPFPGNELQTALKNLILEFEKSAGYESLAKAAPLIFDYREDGYGGEPGSQMNFSLNPLSWALIYLDGLEANLNMIKVSGPAIN